MYQKAVGDVTYPGKKRGKCKGATAWQKQGLLLYRGWWAGQKRAMAGAAPVRPPRVAPA